MPDSASSCFFRSFHFHESRCADRQLCGDGFHGCPDAAVDARIHQAMSIAAIAVQHNSFSVLSALRHERARNKHDPAANALLSASIEKPISRRGFTLHNPCESPRSGETNWKDKRIERMVGVRGFEPPTPASRTQYSTRLSYTPNQLFSNTYFCYTQLVSTSQARGQQLYAGRDIPAIRNCSENVQN